MDWLVFRNFLEMVSKVALTKIIATNLSFFLLLMTILSSAGYPDEVLVDDFSVPSSWRFIGDSVMGGLSTGSISYKKDGSAENWGCLNGSVSTANNGGFIQMRRDISSEERKSLKDVASVIVEVKGNDEEYFIHLRTKGMLMPWTYYYMSFIARRELRKFTFPLDEFKRSGRFLGREFPRGGELKSIGIVAYGKDYRANLCVKKLSFNKASGN